MNYQKLNDMAAGLGPLVAQVPPEHEPFPDKLPEVGPETRWQTIWREMWGLMTAEESWNKHYEPVMKWYRLHFAATRQAFEGRMVPRRFAVGWYDFETDVWHYYLIPLNTIVAISRSLFQLVAYKIPRGILERRAGYYFRAGYKEGFKECARELDKHNLLGQREPRRFPFNTNAHHAHFTATSMAAAMHKADSEFEKKQQAIVDKVKQEIEKELFEKFTHMYVGVDPSMKPYYTAQYMNDPIPFPTAIKPPAIEAGSPVGVNHEGKVYALTGVDLAAHLFGFATDKPDDEGFVLVKTSNNAVTKIKAVMPPPSLEAKHED